MPNSDTYPALVSLGPFISLMDYTLQSSVVSGVIVDVFSSSGSISYDLIRNTTPGTSLYACATNSTGLVSIALAHHPSTKWIYKATYPVGAFDPDNRPTYIYSVIQDLEV